MKKIIFPVFVFSFILVQCADFRDAFSGPPRSTYQTKQKSQDHVPLEEQDLGDVINESIKTDNKSHKIKFSDDNEFSSRPMIRTKQGIYYYIKEEDSLEKIAERFKIEPIDLAQINNIFDDGFFIGRRLFIPHPSQRRFYITHTKQHVSRHVKAQNRKEIRFIWPCEGRVTSAFGMRYGRPHSGIDIGAKVGTPIYAVADGKVLYADSFSDYGRLIVIMHRKGYVTAYAHADKLFVKKGKKVKQGDKIATIGMTGRTTGPHLHFEIRRGVEAVNPLTVLPTNSVKK